MRKTQRFIDFQSKQDMKGNKNVQIQSVFTPFSGGSGISQTPIPKEECQPMTLVIYSKKCMILKKNWTKKEVYVPTTPWIRQCFWLEGVNRSDQKEAFYVSSGSRPDSNGKSCCIVIGLENSSKIEVVSVCCRLQKFFRL